MQKIIRWFLKNYEDKDLAIQRKSLYTFYFVALGTIMIMINVTIDFFLGMSGFLDALISFSMFSGSLLLIKKGKLQLVSYALTIAGLAFAYALLFMDNNIHIFLPFCMLGLIMIALIHIGKTDLYFGFSMVIVVVVAKLIKELLKANTVPEISYSINLFLTFGLFLVLAFLITKIVSDEINRSKELLGSNAELEKSNKAKVDFISNVSHELRTPLNGIIGIAELISFNEKASPFKKDVNTILSSAKHLLVLINQILNISKINHISQKLDIQLDSIENLLYEVECMFKGVSTEKHISFYVFLSSKVSKQIYLDSFKLKQVLINLLSNAFKFTEKGHVSLYVELIENSYGKQKIRFSVSDTGIGIKKEEQEKIFEEFKQGQLDFAKQYEGTGLGLSISSKLIEQMESEIIVESKEGIGSKFRFDLLCEVVNVSVNKEKLNKDVMLICDDSEALSFFDLCFNDYGIKNIIAESREEAEDYLEEVNKETLIFVFGEDLINEIRNSRRYSNFKKYYFNSILEQNDIYQLTQKNIIDIVSEEKSETENHEDSYRKIDKFFGIKALIVEDNIINSTIVQRYLKLLDIEADFAKDSVECEALLKDNFYNIIFLDIQLPKVSGFELIKSFKEEWNLKSKIIAFTASIGNEFRNMCIESGFDDFLAKPFVFSDVERILKKYFPNSFKITEIKNEKLYENLFLILKEDCLEKIGEISEYIKEENYNKIVEISHYMKSGAGSAQQFELYRQLMNLEHSAMNSDKINIIKNLELIKLELNKAEEYRDESINN